jgi:AcrR family transcriptional regulator
MRPQGIVWLVTGTRDVRERLSRAAYELLREGGLAHASPAQVAERAGASKMSLYRHFSGIDELVAVALGEHDAEHRARLLGAPVGTARERIERMLDSAADRADQPDYRGCAYVDTRVEVADPDHPVAAVAQAHKRAMNRALGEMLAEAGDPRPQDTALLIQMLFDGAIVHAVVMGNGDPIRAARAALPTVAPALYAEGRGPTAG